MQTVDFNIPEKKLEEYVSWAKDSAVLGVKTKIFEFNGILFFDAAHVSLVRHKSDPSIYIATIHCDHIERKKEIK